MISNLVAVSPPSAVKARARLFRALESVFPVTFQPRSEGSWQGADALIVFGPIERDPGRIPRLEYDTSSHRLGNPFPGRVHFSQSLLLDERLRGRHLVDRSGVSVSALAKNDSGEHLAEREGSLVWQARGLGDARVDVAAVPPSELQTGMSLRDYLSGKDWLGLLPLIHFLRAVTDYEWWSRPPARATFLIDDPNLHWPSYGFVEFERLARHAHAHGYHVALATIPLDSWFVHRKAAQALINARSQLSLAIHGNDHLYRELECIPPHDAAGLLRQALRRIARLEERTGLSVARVMIPPHGVCADHMFEPLVDAGFEALCRRPRWWTHRADDIRGISGWGVADVSYGGLPVMTRHLLGRERLLEDLVLSTFLDQPLITYGHHHDFADGYGRLVEIVSALAAVRPIEWMSLDRIARSNFMTRRDERGRLRIKMFSRRIRIRIPVDVEEVLVELPAGYGGKAFDSVLCGEKKQVFEPYGQGAASPAIPVTAGDVDVVLSREIPTTPDLPVGLRPQALLRRMLTEGRDRMLPMVRRAGLESAFDRTEKLFHSIRG